MPKGSRRRAEPHEGKGSKLYVQPAELARKLVKEMEDHKVSRSTHVSVRNRYTVYLCPEDYERFSNREEQLVEKLERHLAKHVRAKRYEVPGEIIVALVEDPDLKLGHFGILAERELPENGRLSPGMLPVPSPTERPSMLRSVVASTDESPAERSAPVLPKRPVAPRPDPEDGATQVIAAKEAVEWGLARQTIVLTAGNRVREFSQGRVILGRARDADFRVDDPDVSRRHVAIYWSDGAVVVEDLGSTNGTIVNGRAVSSAAVRSGDVISIGDCRITLEIR
jgi:hypothetical protein